MAETSKSQSALDGVQRIYFEENGQRLAVVTAMAEKNLQGAFISLAAAPVVDARSLGLALCQVGISVLRMEGCINEASLKSLHNLLEEEAMPGGTHPLTDDDIPF